MKTLLLCLVLALCTSALFAKEPRATVESPRIVGGSRADAGQFPFLTFLSFNGGSYCTGFLISMEWVVSAAHCFYGLENPNVTVYAGAIAPTNFSIEPMPFVRQVQVTTEVIVHPKYDPSTNEYDVSLLKLPSELIRTQWVDSVLLANDTTFDAADEGVTYNAYVAGYGTTLDDSDAQILARYVALPLVKFKTCDKVFDGDLIEGQHICAGGVKGEDSCYGDSGGPLFWTNNVNNVSASDSKTYVIGITSFGNGCAKKDYPGVYSDVVNMAKSWVNKKVLFSADVAQLYCGDGIVSEGEDCEYNSDNSICCDWTTCTYLSTGTSCGILGQGQRLGTCKKRVKRCSAAHSCRVKFLADGASCPLSVTDGVTTFGTCASRVCA